MWDLRVFVWRDAPAAAHLGGAVSLFWGLCAIRCEGTPTHLSSLFLFIHQPAWVTLRPTQRTRSLFSSQWACGRRWRKMTIPWIHQHNELNETVHQIGFVVFKQRVGLQGVFFGVFFSLLPVLNQVAGIKFWSSTYFCGGLVSLHNLHVNFPV